MIFWVHNGLNFFFAHQNELERGGPAFTETIKTPSYSRFKPDNLLKLSVFFQWFGFQRVKSIKLVWFLFCPPFVQTLKQRAVFAVFNAHRDSDVFLEAWGTATM